MPAFARVQDLKVCVVLPAYNAARTLQDTLDRLQPGSYDYLILVDDCSSDDTAEVARSLAANGYQIEVHEHPENRGYGGNQKSCYLAALRTDADVVVMLHPDNQYDGALIPYMVGFIAADVVDVVFGSRILRRKDVLAGGMPPIKYFANRVLTILENIVFGFNLPEYHTGFRAYHRRALEKIRFEAASDDFVFDQHFTAQARVHELRVGAVPVPTRYGHDSSSISFGRSVRYSLETFAVMARYALFRAGWRSQELFCPGRPGSGGSHRPTFDRTGGGDD